MNDRNWEVQIDDRISDMLAVLDSPLSQPFRDGTLIKFASGKLKNHLNSVFGRIGNLEIIQCEEQPSKDPGGPLVAVREGMITRQTIGIGGSEFAQIRLAIGPLIAGARQCRFQCICVTQTDGAAMLGQLPIMDGKRHLGLDPDRFG